MHHRYRRAGLLLLSLALVLPATAADEKKEDKKDDKKKAVPAKVDPKDKRDAKEKALTSGKPILGKLVLVEAAQKYLTVEITVPETDPGKVQGHANWRVQRQLEISRVADPRERAKQTAQFQIEWQQRSLDIYRQGRHRIEVQAADEMKVRTLLPPVEYDDKGKPRKYTAKELKELKGPDPKLPGYAADFDSLKAEQTVEVYLAKGKDAPKSKAKAKDKEDAPEAKPQVTMIVIHYEPPK